MITTNSRNMRRFAALSLLPWGCILSPWAGAQVNREASAKGKAANEAGAVPRKAFYCNIAALRPAERARHGKLTKKLLESQKATVETDKGYELQFSPKDVSVGELAEWVAADRKCCPFFDFHIDVEGSGSLLCLRLTGGDGIKAFLRATFGLASK